MENNAEYTVNSSTYTWVNGKSRPPDISIKYILCTKYLQIINDWQWLKTFKNQYVSQEPYLQRTKVATS